MHKKARLQLAVDSTRHPQRALYCWHRLRGFCMHAKSNARNAQVSKLCLKRGREGTSFSLSYH